MANDLIPYKRPGEDVTGYCTAAVTGKRCVQISAAKPATEKAEGLGTTGGGGTYRVALPSGAGANGGAALMIFGVAKYDAAINRLVGVVRGGIVPITASAAITAGQKLQVAADGTVVPFAAGTIIGIACDDCANGADCEVALNIG
jgi:hypothetical protein